MIELRPIWFLAQSDIHRMGSSIPTPDSGTQEIRWFDDMAIVMGIGLLLMLALALWVKFFRKSSSGSQYNSFSSDLVFSPFFFSLIEFLFQ